MAIIHKTLQVFPETHVGVALASRCASLNANPCELVRQGQQQATALDPRVFVVADSDRIWGPAYRYDGCHFSALGAQLLADDYYRAIAPILGLPEPTSTPDNHPGLT